MVDMVDPRVGAKGRLAEAERCRSSDSGFDDEVSSTSLSDLSLEDERKTRGRESTPPSPQCMSYADNLACGESPYAEYSPSADHRRIEEPGPASTGFWGSLQDDYLQFIEPGPVLPPNYNTLPPGGCPKFPVLSSMDGDNDQLPEYSPTVYKIGVVARKVEWLSPYEPSAARSWKHVIIELNSTQLNFYSIPGPLETHLLSFKAMESHERGFNEKEEEEVKCLNSILTSHADLQFFKFAQRLNLLSDDDSSGSTPSLNLSKSKIKNKKLLRSYSLQHARMGLATDYKKRANVVRVRIESEQLLLNFGSTQELIDWHLAFSSGRDVSLDILQRELPRERTLPRRRRRSRSRRNSQGSAFMSGSDPSRTLSNLSTGEGNKIKDKVLRFKSKFLSRTKSVDLSKVDKGSLSAISEANLQRARSPSLPTFNISNSNNCYYEDNDDDSYTLHEYHGPPTSRNRSNSLRDDDYEEDIQDMSDLHASDDEDDEFDCNIEDFNDENNDNDDNNNINTDSVDDTHRQRLASMSRRFTLPSSVSTSNNNYKWHPLPDKPQSQRRYYRNCLRCIRPLTTDDTWVSKSVVKPTTLSPINFTYLRNIKYANSNTSSSSSLASIGSQAFSTNSYSSTQTYRKRSLSFKDNYLSLPDVALTRLPNHFLKEYMVGSHGLIPKEI